MCIELCKTILHFDHKTSETAPVQFQVGDVIHC